MKKIIVLWSGLFFLFQGICLAEAPSQVAGFILGKDIADHKGKLHVESTIDVGTIVTIMIPCTKSRGEE